MPTNPESILDSVKKVVGFDADYTAFDLDITMFINAAFGSLKQLGVGSDSGFLITDNSTLWAQYTSNLALLGMVKTYIFMVVRLAFDPPATSFGIEAIERQVLQLGWRINVEAETADPPTNPFDSPPSEGGMHKAYFAPKVVVLTFASTVTPDASKGNMFYLTMTADGTIDAPVNGVDGEHITLEVISNGHSVTWGSGWNFGDAGTPTMSGGGKADIISGYYRQSTTDWRAGFTPGF